jgi:hypothetical protein
LLKAKKPDHPLIKLLDNGMSIINSLYLTQALKDIDLVINKDEPSELELKNLFRKKTQLVGQRAILSNSFHNCKSDHERAEVSEEIQLIQHQIVGINQKIRKYEETGEIPSDSKLDNLPGDLYKLFLIKENARKNIPRLEKAIEELFQLPETPKTNQKIQEKEEKLKELKLIKTHVEKLIKDQDIQSH